MFIGLGIGFLRMDIGSCLLDMSINVILHLDILDK